MVNNNIWQKNIILRKQKPNRESTSTQISYWGVSSMGGLGGGGGAEGLRPWDFIACLTPLYRITWDTSRSHLCLSSSTSLSFPLHRLNSCDYSSSSYSLYIVVVVMFISYVRGHRRCSDERNKLMYEHSNVCTKLKDIRSKI